MSDDPLDTEDENADPQHLCQLLEYEESKGYWTSEKFLAQLKEAVKIAEAKYPKEDGWKIVWIFDHSSCHSAMPDDTPK